MGERMVERSDDATEQGHATNEVLQLRFRDEDGDLSELNAYEVAEVLWGLSAFSGRMAKAGLFGDGSGPEVKVRPLREGSFILDAILEWSIANPEGAFAIGGGTVGALVTAFRMATKRMRARPSNMEYLENGNVKVIWQDNTVSEVPVQTWEVINSMTNPTKRAVKNILSPLGGEADALELRAGDTDQTTESIKDSLPIEVFDAEEYREVSAAPEEVEETSFVFEVEGRLQTIDFEPGAKWRVVTKDENRKAEIEDMEFLQRVDDGLPLHKTDIFRFRIREDQVTKDGRTARHWTILEVVRHRRGLGDDEQI